MPICYVVYYNCSCYFSHCFEWQINIPPQYKKWSDGIKIEPVIWTKIDRIKHSAETVKGCDLKYHKLVQIWNQLMIKDGLLWRSLITATGGRLRC